MQLDRILKLDDLCNIQAAIDDAGYGNDRLEVTMKVRSAQIMQQINSDLYYRNNKEGNPDTDVEEVYVNIGNINFKYVLDEDAE